MAIDRGAVAAHARRAAGEEDRVIDRGWIIHYLADRKAIADWVLVERVVERAVVTPTSRRREQTTRWAITIHVDVPEGRGSAHVEIGPGDADAGDIVDQSIALASTAIGEAWSSVPQAAPAKVTVLDPALAKADVVDHAVAIARAIRAPAASTVVEIARTDHHVEAHSGLRTEWTSSSLRAGAIVTAGPRSLEIAREARRLVDLDIDPAIASATTDLALLATATPPTAGKCTLVIGSDALLHGGGYGMWSVFATQADAVLERQGLARYRIGKPVATGAEAVKEPLSISSDGSRPFGMRSAPVSDGGDAVRRFAIVEGGVSVGLGLSPREAALRRNEPNGDVRNLDVGLGTWQGDRPPGRVIEIRRLRSLAIDHYGGDASLEIALGLDGDKPFTGGTIRIDLVAALASARRSQTRLERGPYRGPASVMIEDIELLA
jgi:hypothetical protein